MAIQLLNMLYLCFKISNFKGHWI